MPTIFLITGIAVHPLAYCEASNETTKQAIAIPNLFISSDSEGFNATKIGGAYLPNYEHGDSYYGLTTQYNQYSQNGWSATGSQVGVVVKDVNTHTGLGYNANLGVNVISGSSVLTTDSSYGFAVTKTTRFELLLNRDRVETQNSITNGIYYTLLGASIEQQVVDRFTLVGMLGNMYFSDGNTRPLFRARAVYDLLPDYGVTAQIRYRQYSDTNTNVVNNYFNPDSYNETMLALGIKQKVNGWLLSGTAGIGRQTVNADPSTTTQLLEASATSPFTSGIFFRARVGYSRSAGFNGPDYSYSYFLNELIFSF